ncbi:MAG: alpha/beta fold hydrolase, partial [Thermoleophilaceae bacterium]
MRRDPGLAAERTQLAWQRFALSLAVIGALGLRAGLAHHHSTLGFATAALLGAAAAGLQLRGPRMAARSAIRAALAATLLAAALALALAGPASAAPFHGCPGSDTWLCARVTVPLDRSGAVRGNVHLVVERLRARRSARTAVMGFPGGPGAATLSGRDGWLRDLAPSLGGRDLLLFDQRGIGRSDYLQCGVYVGLVPPLAVTRLASAKSVQRCAQRLGDRRRFYTTRDTVEDIESVRQAAHVDKLVLVGVSYGTRTALAYAAAHPDHVERIVLDSVVAPDGVDAYLLDTLRAVPRVLGRLCRGGGCDGITSDPTADLRALVARLEQKPLRLHRPIDFFGCHFRPAVTRSAVLDTLVAGDLEDPLLRAAVPAAIKAALEGDAEPLAVFGIGQDDLRLVLCLLSQIGLERPVPGLPLDRGDSEAAYVATLCGDGPLPWTTSTPFSRRRRAAEDVLGRMSDEAFAPFDRATALASETLNICKFWPEAGPGPPADADPLPALPALVLSGEDDLRTPTETAREVAGRIPGAQFLP